MTNDYYNTGTPKRKSSDSIDLERDLGSFL